MRSIEYLVLAGLLLAVGTVSCATNEPALESSEELEQQTAPAGQRIYPEWFEPGVEGMMADGDLIGYGRAVSSSVEHSKELAQEHALESLRFYIDRFLEEESESLSASWNGSGSMSTSLRAAVASLDLSSVSLRSNELSRLNELEETVTYVVEARISAEAVGAQLQGSLESLPVQRLFQGRAE